MQEKQPIILLNTIHPDLANLYEPQKALADYFGLSIETIHKALSYFEVRSFAEAVPRDTLCESTKQIEDDLLRIERDYGASLADLAQSNRIILLIENATSVPHVELAMALCLFVSAMSRSWPDILGIQFNYKDPYTFYVSQEFQMRDTLTGYSTMENRQVIYPRQERVML